MTFSNNTKTQRQFTTGGPPAVPHSTVFGTEIEVFFKDILLTDYFSK